MKFLRYLSVLPFSFLSLQFSLPAQAQSRPEFCQIHAGNVNQYVSQYNIINHSSPTIYRPFIQNSRVYNVNKELIAKPLYYVSISDGSIGTAFQLSGKLGNNVISNKDVVVQHIKYYPASSYIKIVGHCVNGTFLPNQRAENYNIYNLPLDTQSALNEASLGIQAERVGAMFK